MEVTGYGLWVLAKGSCSERARWTTDEDGWHTTTQHDTTQHSTAQHLSDWTEIERGERREGWRFEAKEAKEVEV